ncbi:Asp-tRNA(Asn)/Glu-tRNA(Gln) amidotransferase subunit GatC [Tautonia rosea]|nr:hypothetical protein [Tautonia rosea]
MRPPSPQERPDRFGPEPFRLYAKEVLRLELEDQQLEALRGLVNSLIAEMELMDQVDLDGVEPDIAFALDPEGWPR